MGRSFIIVPALGPHPARVLTYHTSESRARTHSHLFLADANMWGTHSTSRQYVMGTNSKQLVNSSRVHVYPPSAWLWKGPTSAYTNTCTYGQALVGVLRKCVTPIIDIHGGEGLRGYVSFVV